MTGPLSPRAITEGFLRRMVEDYIRVGNVETASALNKIADTFGIDYQPQQRRTNAHDPNRDGLPFWISTIQDEDGLMTRHWGIRFSMREGAEEAARAIVGLHYAHAVFIHEDLVVVRPAKNA